MTLKKLPWGNINKMKFVFLSTPFASLKMIMDAPAASKSDQTQFLLVIKFLQKECGSKI